jgi:hypothetical protein
MAEFTQNGNTLDKYDDVVIYPWKVQDLGAMDRFSNARKETNQNWHAEIGSFSYTNGGMRVVTPPFDDDDFSDLEGDIVIMGHGNYGDRIGKDSGYVHSARSLAKLLADGGLPLDYGGKVILWSCFGGVLNGAAQTLAFKLQGRGYMTLSVWGCKWVTGVMANKTFYSRPNTTMNNVGTPDDNAETTLADMNSY